MIEIFCDGACRGNPGESGFGVVVYSGGNVYRYAGGYLSSGTNNIAELMALKTALTIADNLGSSKKVVIKTDSQYSKNVVLQWAAGWERNGWKKKGGLIKNLELIQEIYALYNKLSDRVSIEYVKAHCGIEGNEEADRMANMAVDRKILSLERI